MEDSPYVKKCRYKFCEKSFVARRLNQEYCSYDHKTKHNNWIARQARKITKDIDNVAHYNRDVLFELYTAGKVSISYDALERKGFKINFPTHTKKDISSKKRIIFFYDFGLFPIDLDHFKIIKANE